jgi:hypothetical protein
MAYQAMQLISRRAKSLSGVLTPQVRAGFVAEMQGRLSNGSSDPWGSGAELFAEIFKFSTGLIFISMFVHLPTSPNLSSSASSPRSTVLRNVCPRWWTERLISNDGMQSRLRYCHPRCSNSNCRLVADR